MTDPLLACRNATRTLTGDIPVTLVNDATLTITPGEFVAITGPSGSGKSSLLYLLGLLDKPTSGSVWIQGTNATALSEDEVARHRLASIGFVFQYHFLLPEFTVRENVTLPMRRLGELSDEAIKARSTEILSGLGLGDQMHKLPSQLSGGQRQRVAIARALANKPALILADEPTGNLDSVSSKNVQDILASLARSGEHAVIVVTHDQAFAARADRIVHIVDGKIQSP